MYIKDVIAIPKNNFHLKYVHNIFPDEIIWWLRFGFSAIQGWMEEQRKQTEETRLIIKFTAEATGGDVGAHHTVVFTPKYARKFPMLTFFKTDISPPDTLILMHNEVWDPWEKGKTIEPIFKEDLNETVNTEKALYIIGAVSPLPFRKFYCTIT